MQIICFDLDNTLVNSTKAHLEALKIAFNKNKLPKKTNKEIIKFFSLESYQLVKNLYPSLNEKTIKKTVKDHDSAIIKNTGKHVKIIPGSKEILKHFKDDYKIAILSNCKKKEILSILKYAKIDQNLFDLIIGNDMVKHPKPAPDEIFKAKQLLKVKKGFMVGDSIYDIRAGKKAKLKTIAVLTGDHTKKQLQKEKPWKLAKSIIDLKEIIV